MDTFNLKKKIVFPDTFNFSEPWEPWEGGRSGEDEQGGKHGEQKKRRGLGKWKLIQELLKQSKVEL